MCNYNAELPLWWSLADNIHLLCPGTTTPDQVYRRQPHQRIPIAFGLSTPRTFGTNTLKLPTILSRSCHQAAFLSTAICVIPNLHRFDCASSSDNKTTRQPSHTAQPTQLGQANSHVLPPRTHNREVDTRHTHQVISITCQL